MVIAGSVLAACGPTKSTTSIMKARSAIKRAEMAEAQKKHPYELALAREYYVKAKEEAGYSKYELAEKLAKQAIAFALVAAGQEPPPPPGSDEDEEDPNP